MSNRARKKLKSRAKDPNGLPKGAYPLPSGGYATESRGEPVSARSRGIRLTVSHRRPVGVNKLAHAVRELAIYLDEHKLDPDEEA